MARAVSFAMIGGMAAASACGGDAAGTTIRVSAEGATWMAVRAGDGEPWQRLDGADVSFEARGLYDVAVVCREDIGDGWSMRATPDDGTRWSSVCRYAGTVQPRFAITGRADVVFVGRSASYPPAVSGEPIEPGTYDVVAMQRSTGVPARTERVQVIRGVVVDGVTPIAIDVGGLGLPPEAVTVRVAGGAPDFAYVSGTTAGGTWFSFQGVAMALPAAHTLAGDRQLATIHDGDAWAEVPIEPGDNDVIMPVVTVTPAFGPGPAVTWPVTSEWPLVTLSTFQWSQSGPAPPWWRFHVYSDALSASVVDGVARVELVTPELEGWRPGWMTDLTRPHQVTATWSRPRADGGREGLTFGERR